MITYEEEMNNRRDYVKFSLEDTWARRQLWENEETNLEPFAQQPFFDTIWEMSTTILPNLEVQVVIDDNDNCFVSSGSSGFVSFMQEPAGLKLPIKCWIHTHPFGSAYFSGTDMMKETMKYIPTEAEGYPSRAKEYERSICAWWI